MRLGLIIHLVRSTGLITSNSLSSSPLLVYSFAIIKDMALKRIWFTGQYYQGWKPGGQQQPPRPHTPPNYLKQHLQNKMAFGYGGMGPPQQQQQQQQQPMGPPPMVVSAPTVAPPADESNGATSVITTGPDGTPLDDASQQSTLSNASAASNEEPPGTPKRSKQDLAPPQQQQFQSPGGPNSMHDETFGDSPGSWPRTPASPVSIQYFIELCGSVITGPFTGIQQPHS